MPRATTSSISICNCGPAGCSAITLLPGCANAPALYYTRSSAVRQSSFDNGFLTARGGCVSVEIMPVNERPQPHPLDPPIMIAHRGASGYAPENTPAAFHKAVELGCQMIELDVRLSADQVPV